MAMFSVKTQHKENEMKSATFEFYMEWAKSSIKRMFEGKRGTM